jgi:hypothetical protein
MTFLVCCGRSTRNTIQYLVVNEIRKTNKTEPQRPKEQLTIKLIHSTRKAKVGRLIALEVFVSSRDKKENKRTN